MGSEPLKKAVFFDRDGTLIDDVDYLSDPGGVVVRAEALGWVREAHEKGYLAVVITNQSGVARGLYSEKDVHRVNDRVRELFDAGGAPLDAFYHCPHHPEFPPGKGVFCECRKPAPGMILKAARELGIDLAQSAVIGDHDADWEAGRRAGVSAVFDANGPAGALLDWIRWESARPKRYSLRDRKSLVSIESFPPAPDPEEARAFSFLKGLPDVLAGRGLKQLVSALREARDKGRMIAWALGGHVVKVGLAPYLRALVDEGFVTFFASNGAFPVHDLEIALVGATSEDVASSLNIGEFGMAEETGDAFATILEEGARGMGLGAAVGSYIVEKKLPHSKASVCARAHEKGIPFAVFPAMGAEIPVMHPGHRGASLGRAAEIDFRKLVDAMPDLSGGGVWLNVGSAVVLPEVFLKALNLAVNLFGPIEDYTTANLDMIQHYRPRVNVVERPGSRGIALTGHHEILIPLLYHALHEMD